MRAILLVVLLLGSAVSSWGQAIPMDMSVDSSLRVEFLFGSQTVRETAPLAGDPHLLRFDFDPRLPVLSGMVELTPLPFASGRLAGSISVMESSAEHYRGARLIGVGAEMQGHFASKPDFSAWEAAGLYHLYSGGGYRFSVTGGYRNHKWVYSGQSIGAESTGTKSRDSFTSDIPFMGLQTAMYFPWWKSRFEILGSPLVTTRVSGHAEHGAHQASYDVKARRGGLIEAQAEGTVQVSPRVMCGLFGRVTYEELYGTINGNVNATGFLDQEAFVRQTLAVVGLDLSVMF